jgi:hypothetical protein
MTDGWETVERPPLPEIFDVREEPLTGIYVETRAVRVRDNFGSSPDGKRDTVVHVFHYGDDPNGKLVSVFGKPDLDSRMGQVTPGALCRVTYLGQEELEGGKKLSKFSVETRSAGANETSRSGAQEELVHEVAEDDIHF